jgi:hypothetical protein
MSKSGAGLRHQGRRAEPPSDPVAAVGPAGAHHRRRPHGAWFALLGALVVLRLVFHAVFIPVFEGPDEPFHLGRAAMLADGTEDAWAGRTLPPDIVQVISGVPCCPDLSRAFGCPPFDGQGAAFNILRQVPAAPPQAPTRLDHNYEAHQPPLFYLVGAAILRCAAVLAPAASRGVPARLLLIRLLSVVVVAIAIAAPLRRAIGEYDAALAACFLLLLLLPGAAESLARCANDGVVFLWSAVVIWAACRRSRSSVLVALLAVGPLIKLTAFPVAIFALVWLWRERSRGPALLGAMASAAVFPLQALRGWEWGGTVEMNAAAHAAHEPLLAAMAGFARSLYTFLKTTVWLGEWSFFRPPPWWLGILLAIGVWCVLAVRRRRGARHTLGHLLALIAAAAGITAFAVGQYRLFGAWGGLGGWYAWGWFPWLAAAAGDTLELRPGFAATTVGLLASFVLLTNGLWLAAALHLYGWP